VEVEGGICIVWKDRVGIGNVGIKNPQKAHIIGLIFIFALGTRVLGKYTPCRHSRNGPNGKQGLVLGPRVLIMQ
jgi:hypothetical protein